MLKKSEARRAVLFTINNGPIPVWNLHLYCERMQFYSVLSSLQIVGWYTITNQILLGCKVNYHHNFRVHESRRIYYNKIPDILQVGEHQFAERKLINLWILMMLLSWSSATNCAQIYNMGFTNIQSPKWQFNLQVTSDQVYDGFIILSLLEDCKTQQATLVVPHGGLARDRFTEAICARNERLRLSSQPELLHHCNKWRIYQQRHTRQKENSYSWGSWLTQCRRTEQ